MGYVWKNRKNHTAASAVRCHRKYQKNMQSHPTEKNVDCMWRGKKETAVRNRTETAPNNKSSCVAKKQAVVVAWTHPEKCGIPL